MGTYINLLGPEDYALPEEVRPLFFERMRTVFEKGGILRLETAEEDGKRIYLLHPAVPDENGCIRARYSYFEDDTREEIRFGPDGRFLSGKVGEDEFYKLVRAACVLMEEMSGGAVLADIPGRAAMCAASWLNHILGTRFSLAVRRDPWRVRELLHRYRDWCSEAEHRRDFKEYMVPWDIPFLSYDAETYVSAMDGSWEELLKAVRQLSKLVEKAPSDPEYSTEASKLAERLPDVLRALRELYGEDGFAGRVLNALTLPEPREPVPEAAAAFYDCRRALPAAVMVKGLASLTGDDFWTLWDRIADRVQGGANWIDVGDVFAYRPLSTALYFGVHPDDMLCFQSSPDVSRGAADWLAGLRDRYAALLAEPWEPRPRGLLSGAMLDTLEKARVQFGGIFMFRDTFYELLDHAPEKRYQALWVLFERLVEENWGEKVERKRYGSQYGWPFNSRRMRVRRYLAILANRELRGRLFGV